jgi:RND superfamily putative drug exporter
MMSMAVSKMTVVAQIGSTIGLGLLFDTLVIRAFMTPSIAALLGRWFWWPQMVRTRPVPVPFPSAPSTASEAAAPAPRPSR